MRTPQFANESQLLCSHVSCIYIVESSPRNASFLLLYCTYLKRLFFILCKKKVISSTQIFLYLGETKDISKDIKEHTSSCAAHSPVDEDDGDLLLPDAEEK